MSPGEELHAVLGAMLDQVADRIRTVADDWVHAGKDVCDLVIVIGVRGDGCGKVFPQSRRDFAAELARDAERDKSLTLSSAAHELVSGPRDRIPGVFCVLDPPAIHVVWLEPVAPSELH